MTVQFRRLRHQATFQVTLQTDTHVGLADVLDINETGARLACKQDMQTGQKVTLSVRKDRITGIVRWVGDGRIGVSFTPHASQKLINRLRFNGRAEHFSRYDSRGLREMR